MTTRYSPPRRQSQSNIFATILVWGPVLAFLTFLVLTFTGGIAQLEAMTYGSEVMVPNSASPHVPLKRNGDQAEVAF
jgi:hypothetical protein